MHQPPVADQHPALALIVRDELRALSLQLPSRPAAYLESKRTRWLKRLRLAGMGSAAGACALEIERQIELALAGHAPWLRTPGRAVEVAVGLSGLVGRIPVDVVLDVTYIDASGQRSIVLIDPTQPDPETPQDEFIAAQRDRLRDHVHGVTQFARDYFGEPIRVHIYASALPQLVEWADPLAFSPNRAENRPP